MPFKVRGKQPLTIRLGVRVTPEEKARLEEDAALAGLSISELVRRRYFGRPIVANVDMIAVRELRRLGGLLKHLHNQSGGQHSAETLATLDALRGAIEKLSLGP